MLDCLWLVHLHLKVEGDLYISYVHVVSDTFSACVQARAHHAAWLYHSGLAPHIIPTGGLTGPPPTDSPGWHTPSARRDNLLRDARALMIYQFNRLWTCPP